MLEGLIDDAAQRAARYLHGLPQRRVSPAADDVARLRLLDIPLQDGPLEPELVLAELDDIGSPATVATTGGRYFGFVVGGALPASLAANLLAAAWDQNAALEVMSPVASALEEVCRKWLVSVLGLPADCEAGFVTGTTMANLTALSAARHALLRQVGWDVEAQGLFGAPPITVIVGDEVHVSLLKALSILGLGRERVVRVPVDRQGRMRPDLLPPISGPTVVCLQSGNVNTGAFDPVDEICPRAKEAGAWVHVDGAFGLWAAASPAFAHLVRGVENADSWSTDAHKWLNVPYDSGVVFVRSGADLRAAMSSPAAYLAEGQRRDPMRYVPESSRRARGIEIWAALRSLGRGGLAALIERDCRLASRFAAGFRAAGIEVLNDVVLNQVLVSFGEDDTTARVMAHVQEGGVCWCGGTVWQGRRAMRISVSSWATTEADVDMSLQAILRIATEEAGRT
ncbi:MAG: pyridoxal-dependent decarboxylase [Chloroflexi bacterium RBG_13_66_10]|nr:MAG: pyridoxal-dependent decarboxylase [Chloroflexi bacterium RBG_13_66_10]